MNTQVITKSAQPGLTNLVFADESEVKGHYALEVQKEERDLETALTKVLASHKTKVVTYGAIGVGGTILLATFLWSVVLPAMVALALAVTLGLAGIAAYFKVPSWISSLRAQAELEKKRLSNLRILALRQEEMDHLERLKTQAEANPIPTRERYAQEAAKEITTVRQQAATFEGLIQTQRTYVAEMKRDYPEADASGQEAMIDELVGAHQAMVQRANDADAALDVYKRRTGLLSLQLKTMAGVQSMTEFLRGDGAKRQLEKLLSDTATQAASTRVEAAMSDLRTSVSVANSRKSAGVRTSVM